MSERHLILIVDDTPANLIILGDMLEKEGHEVLVAGNGPEALTIAAGSPHPDLILLDILMPGMDGIEVCRRLKEDLELRLIPVIFISALGLQDQKIRAFHEGAVDYITKPFMVEEVAARVNTHLRLTHVERLHLEIAERRQAEEEKSKLEAQLQQAQKIESIGRLAGGVAHDFNNMLSVILGHTEMALAQTPVEHALHGDLMEIRKAAERSANLTRQLLAFARKQTISPKVIDLNQTVAGMLNMLKRLIGEDIHVSWKPGAGLWKVIIDPSQIDQVLANLCVNARDAITDVGNVTLETENVTEDETCSCDRQDHSPGDYVRLSVRDDGCGMDTVTMSHVFEPFFTTKDAGVGTGLGLSTVYGVVKQNKGFIHIDSKPGAGTTVTVYFPRHRDESEGPGPSADLPFQSGNETLLLVEDEPSILAITARLLSRMGYAVLAAATPQEAVRMAADHKGPIHLLVTDVVMPEMNGRDLFRTLLPMLPGLQCLFMSGYTADVIAHQGVLDPGVHFIQKPFSGHELAVKIREALNQ